LRRQAHGLLRVLADLPALTGLRSRPTLGRLIARTAEGFSEFALGAEGSGALWTFLLERYRYLLEQRGFDVRNVRAVVHEGSVRELSPLSARLELEALPEFTESPDFQQLAVAFKRVRNIARELPDAEFTDAEGNRAPLSLPEPAEQALLAEIDERQPRIELVLSTGENYRAALAEAAKFGPAVDRFFTEVFVMVDDVRLRTARLRLMKRLERLILKLADVSEIVPQSES
jgi:glycyl-tRNA synthetase beta chain